MGRRLPRRVWHTVAALVPLPLIGLGYVAAVPGNPVAFQVELFLSGKGSAYPVTRTADAAPTVLPRQASYLFHTGQKGPRADQVLTANTVTSAGKQLIAASVGGDPTMTAALGIRGEVSRGLKGDRLKPTVSDVALRGPVGGGNVVSSMLVNAILQRDYPLVQGGVLLVATVYVLINLATDTLYLYIDPRLRHA